MSPTVHLTRAVCITAAVSALVLTLVALAGYFDRDPVHLYPAIGKPSKIAVLNFLGYMGLRFCSEPRHRGA